jgi:tRNA C32,U32 (ribose-2'-O)-methylase TrmJ
MVASGGEVALVFGDEQNGLHADEIDQLDQVTTMHSAPEQPSWNLAQAVAVYAHELRSAAIESEERPLQERDADPARMAAVSRALGTALDKIGKPQTHRRLYPTLDRARMSAREASLWIAVLERIRRAVDAKK